METRVVLNIDDISDTSSSSFNLNETNWDTAGTEYKFFSLLEREVDRFNWLRERQRLTVKDYKKIKEVVGQNIEEIQQGEELTEELIKKLTAILQEAKIYLQDMSNFEEEDGKLEEILLPWMSSQSEYRVRFLSQLVYIFSGKADHKVVQYGELLADEVSGTPPAELDALTHLALVKYYQMAAGKKDKDVHKRLENVNKASFHIVYADALLKEQQKTPLREVEATKIQASVLALVDIRKEVMENLQASPGQERAEKLEKECEKVAGIVLQNDETRQRKKEMLEKLIEALNSGKMKYSMMLYSSALSLTLELAEEDYNSKAINICMQALEVEPYNIHFLKHLVIATANSRSADSGKKIEEKNVILQYGDYLEKQTKFYPKSADRRMGEALSIYFSELCNAQEVSELAALGYMKKAIHYLESTFDKARNTGTFSDEIKQKQEQEKRLLNLKITHLKKVSSIAKQASVNGINEKVLKYNEQVVEISKNIWTKYLKDKKTDHSSQLETLKTVFRALAEVNCTDGIMEDYYSAITNFTQNLGQVTDGEDDFYISEYYWRKVDELQDKIDKAKYKEFAVKAQQSYISKSSKLTAEDLQKAQKNILKQLEMGFVTIEAKLSENLEKGEGLKLETISEILNKTTIYAQHLVAQQGGGINQETIEWCAVLQTLGRIKNPETPLIFQLENKLIDNTSPEQTLALLQEALACDNQQAIVFYGKRLLELFGEARDIQEFMATRVIVSPWRWEVVFSEFLAWYKNNEHTALVSSTDFRMIQEYGNKLSQMIPDKKIIREELDAIKKGHAEDRKSWGNKIIESPMAAVTAITAVWVLFKERKFFKKIFLNFAQTWHPVVTNLNTVLRRISPGIQVKLTSPWLLNNISIYLGETIKSATSAGTEAKLKEESNTKEQQDKITVSIDGIKADISRDDLLNALKKILVQMMGWDNVTVKGNIINVQVINRKNWDKKPDPYIALAEKLKEEIVGSSYFINNVLNEAKAEAEAIDLTNDEWQEIKTDLAKIDHFIRNEVEPLESMTNGLNEGRHMFIRKAVSDLTREIKAFYDLINGYKNALGGLVSEKKLEIKLNAPKEYQDRIKYIANLPGLIKEFKQLSDELKKSKSDLKEDKGKFSAFRTAYYQYSAKIEWAFAKQKQVEKLEKASRQQTEVNEGLVAVKKELRILKGSLENKISLSKEEDHLYRTVCNILNTIINTEVLDLKSIEDKLEYGTVNDALLENLTAILSEIEKIKKQISSLSISENIYSIRDQIERKEQEGKKQIGDATRGSAGSSYREYKKAAKDEAIKESDKKKSKGNSGKALSDKKSKGNSGIVPLISDNNESKYKIEFIPAKTSKDDKLTTFLWNRIETMGKALNFPTLPERTDKDLWNAIKEVAGEGEMDYILKLIGNGCAAKEALQFNFSLFMLTWDSHPSLDNKIIKEHVVIDNREYAYRFRQYYMHQIIAGNGEDPLGKEQADTLYAICNNIFTGFHDLLYSLKEGKEEVAKKQKIDLAKLNSSVIEELEVKNFTIEDRLKSIIKFGSALKRLSKVAEKMKEKGNENDPILHSAIMYWCSMVGEHLNNLLKHQDYRDKILYKLIPYGDLFTRHQLYGHKITVLQACRHHLGHVFSGKEIGIPELLKYIESIDPVIKVCGDLLKGHQLGMAANTEQVNNNNNKLELDSEHQTMGLPKKSSIGLRMG